VPLQARVPLRALDEASHGPSGSSARSLATCTQALRRHVYGSVWQSLGHIKTAWSDKSSFLIGDQGNILTYTWELVTLWNKMGIAFITVLIGQHERSAMRAACAWEFVFVVLFVALRPYSHRGLNILSMNFGILLVLIMSTVLVLEIDDGSSPGAAGFFAAGRVINIGLVIAFVALECCVIAVFSVCLLRDNLLKGSLFAVDRAVPDGSGSGRRAKAARSRQRLLSSLPVRSGNDLREEAAAIGSDLQDRGASD